MVEYLAVNQIVVGSSPTYIANKRIVILTNEFIEYKEYARNHLPDGMTFNGGFYWYNNHKFGNYQQALWYYNYLHKTVYSQITDMLSEDPNGFWMGGIELLPHSVEIMLYNDPQGFWMDLNEVFLK